MRACIEGSLPVLRCFNAGNYMYHRDNGVQTSLDAKAKHEIYCVTDVKPTGVIVLQGWCGSTIMTHLSHCAPCHLLSKRTPWIPGQHDPGQDTHARYASSTTVRRVDAAVQLATHEGRNDIHAA